MNSSELLYNSEALEQQRILKDFLKTLEKEKGKHGEVMNLM
jgi:hypothetical protein